MAFLRNTNGTYHVGFRFDGQQFQRSLGTENPTEAGAKKKRIEAFLYDVESGRVSIPDNLQDFGLWVISDGKTHSSVCLPQETTLGCLFNEYRKNLPENAKHASTLTTERTHMAHFLRLLGKGKLLNSVDTAELQRYVNKRCQEDGIRGEKVKARTIKKEIATLRAIWNAYAKPMGHVQQSFSDRFGKLVFPKEKSKPSFQTWEVIQTQIGDNTLTTAEKKNLWDCLFLDKTLVREVLASIRNSPGAPPWLYPMAICAAYTGARRSELIRSEKHDFNLKRGNVQWREKKRDTGKDITFRTVELSPECCREMKKWFEVSPNSNFSFADSRGRAITKDVAHDRLKQALSGGKWAVVRGWHIFRHSLASILAHEGEDQRVIDRILGHQTEEMRQRYQHLFPAKQREVLNRIFS